MKFYSSLTNLKFTWDQVAIAFWNRYPNPHSSHVLTEDTVDRKIEDKKLYSRRIISKTNKLPKWGEKIVGGHRQLCVVEESIVDPVNKTLTTYTRNIGLTKLMTVDERVVYRPHPEDNTQTICERHAWIASNLFGFSYALQTFGMERFKKNAHKAIHGFEHVLNKMYHPALPEGPSTQQGNTLNSKRDKLKEKAKAATELAKQKAAVYATCTGQSTS